MTNQSVWDNHYRREKSLLRYPDENLVRMLSKETSGKDPVSLKAIDIGCGSGRHSSLLADFGIGNVTATDMSMNSLEMTAKLQAAETVQCFNDRMPFKNDVYDIAVAWGSLHYSDKENTEKQISEIIRILKPEGVLFGTLRSSYDSSLRKGKDTGNNTWVTRLADLESGKVSFFTEEEIKTLFSGFSIFEFGIIERTQLNRLNEKISHWYYRAQK